MTSVLVVIFGLALLSIPHCAVMCGPISSLAAGRPASYHLARAAGYTVLGGAAGAVGAGLESLVASRWGQAALSWSLALVLAMAALRQLRRAGDGPVALGKKRHWIARAVAAAGNRPWILGAVTALLPCGVLWAAVALAASAGSSLAGAAAMLAFAAVTSLPLLGAAATVRRARLRGHSRLVAVAFAFGAAVLLIRPLPALLSSPAQPAGYACPLHAGTHP